MSKSRFAQEAGVNPSTVTRLCSTLLKEAVAGKKIDAAHPAAIEYLQNRDRVQTPPAATGLDPLYEEAVQKCQETGRYSTSNIQRTVKVGYDRAKRLLAVMKANGVVPEQAAENPKRVVSEPVDIPKPRGQAAAKETRKRAPVRPVIDYDDEPELVPRQELPENIAEFADWTLQDIVNRFGTDVAFVDFLKALKEIENVAEKRLKNAQSRGELISRQLVKSGMIDTLDGAFTRMLTDGAKTMATRTHALVKTGAEVQEIEDLIAKQLSTFIKPTKSKITRVLRNA